MYLNLYIKENRKWFEKKEKIIREKIATGIKTPLVS
jgi:hypothetical protein